MDEKRTHDMVVCVADRGQAELVMEAAKQAGASGGTVVHARGFNAKEEEISASADPAGEGIGADHRAVGR